MFWDSYYFNKGLRLVELDRDGSDWAAVWRPGSGAQWWRSGIPSWTDFKNQDRVYFEQGLRLVDVVITSDNDITAVWRGDQGNSAQIWKSGIPATGVDANNESEFQKTNRLKKQAGWELRILKTHPNDAYVMAVWRYRGGLWAGTLTPPRPLLAIAGEDDTTDQFAQQKVTIDAARQVNQATGTGHPCGPICTLYPSAIHTPVKTYIVPHGCPHAGHNYPAWAPGVIVEFLKAHPLP